MIRLSGLLFLVLAVGLGAVLFWTSQSVQRLDMALYKTDQGVSNEREKIRLLSAEWEYLNKPERLEALAGQYSHSTAGQFSSSDFASNSFNVSSGVRIPPPPGYKPVKNFRPVDRADEQMTDLLNRTLKGGF